MNAKKAIKWVMFWISAALIFNIGIYLTLGSQKAMEFLGGYVIEESLSLDNLFLFLMVFESFGITSKNQRRVLNYGIIGALILRFIFIFLGSAAVNRFHWVLYIFGIILMISGVKMMVKDEDNEDFQDSKLLKLVGKVLPVTDKLEGEKFFVRKNNILHATPLLAILVLIEGTDILFAVDSIPAIFSISTDSFIVYTSNIFAILGLRCFYFVLVELNNTFKYVKYGVAFILIFTGLKLLILFFNIEIPIGISLAVIFGILTISIIISIILKLRNGNNEKDEKVIIS